LQRAVEPGLGIGPVAGDDELAVGAQLGGAAEALDIGDEAGKIGELVIVEGDERALRPGIELGDAGLAAIELGFNDAEKILCRLGQRAETVDRAARPPARASMIASSSID